MPSSFHTARFWMRCCLYAALLFVALAALYVVGGPLERVDLWFGWHLHEIAEGGSPRLLQLMELISLLGGRGVPFIAAAVALALAARRSWPELLLWTAIVGGGIALNRMFKALFETVRPMVGHLDVAELSSGFPSGHAMLALIIYGGIAYLVALRPSLRPVHRQAWIAAAVTSLLVGFSRLYLTVHYLSDVLGGFAVGFAWLSLCLWVYCLFAQKRFASGVQRPGALTN